MISPSAKNKFAFANSNFAKANLFFVKAYLEK